MSGQAFLSEIELSCKAARIEALVCEKEERDLFYHSLYLRCLRVLDLWIWVGRPVSEDALAEAMHVPVTDLKGLFLRAPALRQLIHECQRSFGSHNIPLMGLAAIGSASQRRWEKIRSAV